MTANSSLGRDIPRPAAWGTAALTVAAAVVGGLAASVVGPRHVSLAVAVAVSLVIGVAAAVIGRRRDAAAARADELSAEDRPPADSQASAADNQAGADVVRVLSGQGRVPWWEAARQEFPSAASVSYPPPPELASYLDTAQVAQCPNCGELTLDATAISNGWDLKCPACCHTWTWRIGTRWPDVTVIPRRRPAAGQAPVPSPPGNSLGPAGGSRAQRR